SRGAKTLSRSSAVADALAAPLLGDLGLAGVEQPLALDRVRRRRELEAAPYSFFAVAHHVVARRRAGLPEIAVVAVSLVALAGPGDAVLHVLGAQADGGGEPRRRERHAGHHCLHRVLPLA